MTDFLRALGVTLTVTALVLISVLAIELINENIAESGFSSGEVLVLNYENNVFSGELLGRSFAFDFSVASEFLPVLRILVFLLSPCSRLLIGLAALAL